ncbi:MAG: hypothetical protein QME51_07665 [Planctomycetota bacterium]|nr:hypothetical protein [Planctomycetota bacterium]MDI6788233.1 hypothetical protein [Planctomycetota bacterium]
MIEPIDKKIEAAADKVGGRLRLCAILVQRLRELRRAGLKQNKHFYSIIEPLLDEIIEDKLVIEEPKQHKK